MKYCVACGKAYEEGTVYCGNCGRPVSLPFSAPWPPPAPASVPLGKPRPAPLTQGDRVAVAAFVLSLLSLVMYVSFPLVIVAFVLSCSARNAVRKKGLRIAGICISSVTLLISASYWVGVLIPFFQF